MLVLQGNRDRLRYPEEKFAVHINAQQFNELLLAELPHLRRYAVALTGTVDAADDLVQDTIERALRKRRLWRPDGRLRSWLMRMLYRLYLNRRKRRTLERDHALQWHHQQAGQPLHGDEAELQQQCRELVRALETLPESQRAAILLIALENVDYQEAAWILGIPVGTLRSRLSRGRETLREQTGTDTDMPALRTVK